jgi:parvulin-like peptidyl-prolyl isomerase
VSETAAPGAFSMKRHLVYVIPTGLAALLLAGCGGSSEPQSVPSDAVAVVGDQTIPKTDFDTLLSQAQKGYKQQHRAFPKAGSQEYTQLQGQIVQYLVQRSEYNQKAKDLGVAVSEAQVDQRLANLKQQYFKGNEAKYRAQLKSQGYTEKQVKDNIRSQLLSEAIYNKVTSDVNVTDADIKKYYDDHKAQYRQPSSRDVRHILVKTQAKANQVYKQLKGGASFVALAKKYSQDPGSRALGGKLTISKGQTVAPFDKVAFSLKTGKMSTPVKTDYGYHIILALTDIKPARLTPFNQVKASIRAQLIQSQKQNKMTKWADDTRKDFCAGKLAYQAGFKPSPDPCVTSTTTGTTGSATTTTG